MSTSKSVILSIKKVLKKNRLVRKKNRLVRQKIVHNVEFYSACLGTFSQNGSYILCLNYLPYYH